MTLCNTKTNTEYWNSTNLKINTTGTLVLQLESPQLNIDRSGRNNNGIYNGSPVNYQFANGTFGDAKQLSSTSNITVPGNNINFNTELNMSFDITFKSLTNNAEQIFFNKWAWSAEGGFRLYKMLDNRFNCSIFTSAGFNGYSELLSDISYTDTNWHWIGVSSQLIPTELSNIYIDGVKQASQITMTAGLNPSAFNLVIGNSNIVIGQVRVYNNGFDNTQMLNNYYNSLAYYLNNSI